MIRRRQLGALARAGKVDDAFELAGHLAMLALHQGDRHQAQLLSHRLDQLVRERSERGDAVRSATAARHTEVINAAIQCASHPLGGSGALLDVLRAAPEGVAEPEYQPMVVLLVAEHAAADAVVESNASDGLGVEAPESPGEAPVLRGLVAEAIDRLSAMAGSNDDLVLRLRLVRAGYDPAERSLLLREARQLRLPRPHAALVLAAEARRNALEGSADEAIEHWRQAVGHAIHDGHTDDAGRWLYAIRLAHVRYGPWTDKIDEEHLLAQALPASTAGRIVRRVRDPENDARRAAPSCQATRTT